MTEDSIIFTPEKSKKIALARLDLLNQWKEFRRKSDNKLQADYDFVNLHNTSNSHLFEILGKISRGTLHRWKNILNGTEDYTKLIPQYRYAKVDEYRTCLTDEEIKIFMGLLLHPNRLCMQNHFVQILCIIYDLTKSINIFIIHKLIIFCICILTMRRCRNDTSRIRINLS